MLQNVINSTWEIFLCKHHAHVCRNAIKSAGTNNVNACTYSLIMELKLHFLQELKQDTQCREFSLLSQYISLPSSTVTGHWQNAGLIYCRLLEMPDQLDDFHPWRGRIAYSCPRLVLFKLSSSIWNFEMFNLVLRSRENGRTQRKIP